VDIFADWKAIRTHFNKSFKTNFHVSIASVNVDNNPTVTPIGSLFLNHDQTGYYFEKFPQKLPAQYEKNPYICVWAVNSSALFWIKSLLLKKFNTYPGIKLYGKLGLKRNATEQEIQKLQVRMKVTKLLNGNKYLWGNMQNVRDISFTKAEKINLGKMTAYI